MTEFPKKITDDPYGAAILIRRLITEQGADLLAALSAGVRADGRLGGRDRRSAYILGQVINKAYVDKDVRGIAMLSGVTILIFVLKGAATYGHPVILSQISNAILANNQRRLFAKLMSESVAFFSERHSSEFLARLTAGANSVDAGAQPADQRARARPLARWSADRVMLMQDPYMALLGFWWRRRRCWCYESW